MSEFAKVFYSESNLLLLPVVGMGLFLATFIGAVVWVMAADNNHLRSLSQLPLEDEENAR